MDKNTPPQPEKEVTLENIVDHGLSTFVGNSTKLYKDIIQPYLLVIQQLEGRIQQKDAEIKELKNTPKPTED